LKFCLLTGAFEFTGGARSDVYKKRSAAELVHERHSNKPQTQMRLGEKEQI
jgi:hypothetical protein